MAIINYAANNPYRKTPQTSWYISNFVFRPIQPASDDSIITLSQQYQYRPDKLSQDLYKTPAYWWVFCIRNPFLRPDPIWNFIAGTTIYVPSAIHLAKVLGS